MTKAKPSDEPISSLIRTRAASLGLVASGVFGEMHTAPRGFMLVVSLAASAGLSAWVKYFNSQLSGAGTGRICHSRALHHRKVAHRYLSRSGGAQFSL
jgi:hypothetical protein